MDNHKGEVNRRKGVLYSVLGWLTSLSFASCFLPLHGFGYLSLWLTVFIYTVILLQRYFSLIYLDYKFVLFSVEIMDLNIFPSPAVKKKHSDYAILHNVD